MTKKYFEKIKPYIWLASFAIFSIGSFWFGFDLGKTIYQSFTKSFIEMVTFIPFLLLSLGFLMFGFLKKKLKSILAKILG